MLGLVTAAAFGQKTERYPIHVITKGVQQIQFRNSVYRPALMVTGDLNGVASKGVTRVQAPDKREPVRVIRKTGTPSHVISKGVARRQYERSNP